MDEDGLPIRVLLVEDDKKTARLLSKYLESHGVTVDVVGDGSAAITLARRATFDVVLLDLMLPGKSGTEVCRAIREHSDVPILMVTALGEEADRVLGLEGGADDYVPKPFSPRELLARVRAHVRRRRGQTGPRTAEVIQVGPLRIDVRRVSATLDGETLVLTAYEFALLRALAEHAGRVMSREQLLDLAKGSAEEAFERSIDVRISRLRQKLGDDPKSPRLLKTVRGMGYVLAAERRAT